MNLHHLRYFVTLAHLEHYTKAARQLSITQPSLSHAISSLEEELSVQLFEKEGRNVVLTRWGTLFLKDAEEILAHLDSSVANLKMVGSGSGTLEIGCIRTLGSTFIPGLMRSFIRDNPDREIRFRLHHVGGLSAEIIAGLKRREFDIAFCSRYSEDPSIDFTRIASQDLVLAVPLDHPLAEQDSVTLQETLPYPQILFDRRSGLREIIDSLFRQVEGKPVIYMEAEEDQVIAGLVAQGFGIAVVPDIHFLTSIPIKTLRITEPVPERDFFMASLKNVYHAPLVTSFMRYAKAYSSQTNILL